VDQKRLAELPSPVLFDKLAGDGALAITIEPRNGDQAYQGVVELADSGMGASAETYFSQSEQLPTVIRLAAAPVYTPGDPKPRWRAGGIMLQATPEGRRDNDDDWERLSLFLETVEPFELVDTELKAEDLLWRLFNEDEVRVLPFEPLTFQCNCDAGRIKDVLESYSEDDRAGLADPDGVIRARCEFCGTVHEVRL
jgi:molecular chaperone Hsp33